MAAWNNFFFAQVGASAALVGLIFVAVSINLTKILAWPTLANRALEALLVLALILINASLMLIPDQSQIAAGVELLAITFVAWFLMSRLNIADYRAIPEQYRGNMVRKIALYQLTMVCYTVAGFSVIAWHTGGLYWLVLAMMLSYIGSLTDAWVLLIEINR